MNYSALVPVASGSSMKLDSKQEWNETFFWTLEQLKDADNIRQVTQLKKDNYVTPSITWKSGSIDFPSYSLMKPIRGICLIINNVNFPGEQVREGSDKDAQDIASVWSQMGFLPVIHRNLSADGMKQQLQLASKQASLNNDDAFICYILSHGKQTSLSHLVKSHIRYYVFGGQKPLCRSDDRVVGSDW